MTPSDPRPRRIIFAFDEPSHSLRVAKMTTTKQSFTRLARYYAMYPNTSVYWMDATDVRAKAQELSEADYKKAAWRRKEDSANAALKMMRSPSRRMN